MIIYTDILYFAEEMRSKGISSNRTQVVSVHSENAGKVHRVSLSRLWETAVIVTVIVRCSSFAPASREAFGRRPAHPGCG